MNARDALELNRRWAQNWGDSEGIEKNAAFNRRWIRDHADEASFFEKVIPAQSVNPEECDRSVNSKTPVMIEEIREGSWAMPITFDGETAAEVRMGSRYMITFQKLQTAEHRYRLEELWTSRRPVVEQLKEDVAAAYVDGKDRVFVVYTDVACWWSFQQDQPGLKLNLTELEAGNCVEQGVFKSTAAKLATDAGGNPADTFTIQPLRKEDGTILLRAFNTAQGEQLKASTMLITEYDYVGVTDWDFSEVGDAKVSSSVNTVSGWNDLKDIRIVRTIKQRWLRPGNIYAWADWDYVGSHYRIGKVDTYQEKRGTEVMFFSWGVEGFGYGNLAGVRKLELFSASANPESDATEDTGVEAVQPFAEDHMILNNSASETGWVPTVELA
jgi:hypothetical protein